MPSNSSVKSNEVLASEVQALQKEVAELKGLFTAFQGNFLRNDIYTIRHEELINRVIYLEKTETANSNARQQLEGAVKLLKGLAATLSIGLSALTIYVLALHK